MNPTPNKLAVLVAVALLAAPVASSAYVFQKPQTIDTDVKSSLIVNVCRLVSFTPDADGASTAQTNEGFMFGGDAAIAVYSRKPPGRYRLRTLATIKGEVLPTFDLRATRVLSVYYGDPGIDIRDGSTLLLFLTRDGDGQLVPADPTRPAIPLATDVGLPTEAEVKRGNALGIVTKLLIGSLSEPGTRRSSAYLLRDMAGEDIVAALTPYAESPDLELAESALSCLAANQKVEAIPKIARLEAAMKRKGMGGSRVVTAIRQFRTPTAVPYLNQLLFDTNSDYTRINAAFTLLPMADRSSIPYLIVALQDPETQGAVSFTAYQALVPMLGLPMAGLSEEEFAKRRTEVISAANVWWVDELQGKHSNGP